MENGEDDAFAAFGDDDDDDDINDQPNEDKEGCEIRHRENDHPVRHRSQRERKRAAESIAFYLVRSFVKENPQVPLSQRMVLLLRIDQKKDIRSDGEYRYLQSIWKEVLEASRGISLTCCRCCVEGDDDDIEGDNDYVGHRRYDAVILDFMKENVRSTSNITSETYGDPPAASRMVSNEKLREFILDLTCPGGYLVLQDTHPLSGVCEQWDPSVWYDVASEDKEKGGALERTFVCQDGENHKFRWSVLSRRRCRVQELTCPWLPSRHCLDRERELLHSATVPLSVHERLTNLCNPLSVKRAVEALRDHGYCVLPGLLNGQECLRYGRAVLQDLHTAADTLLRRDGVDLYHPGGTGDRGGESGGSGQATAVPSEPASYRELSMREDFRMDLRSGPALCALRGPAGNRPCTVPATTVVLEGQFLRGHRSILEIVRTVMNPTVEGDDSDDNSSPGTSSATLEVPFLSRGNFGRYNFDGGGPDGSWQDLRVGPVGGIVSLPGAAEQALHADAPHLFEHLPRLPAHYVNAFAPGFCPSRDDGDDVGQTALVHGSHDLRFSARYCGSSEDDRRSSSNGYYGCSPSLWEYLVRPRLELGDVLLFDCRILHFGMANSSSSGTERPVLYANMTMHWFHDPKNWDDRRPIFDDCKREEETAEVQHMGTDDFCPTTRKKEATSLLV